MATLTSPTRATTTIAAAVTTYGRRKVHGPRMIAEARYLSSQRRIPYAASASSTTAANGAMTSMNRSAAETYAWITCPRNKSIARTAAAGNDSKGN
ncbi:hypothetical protein ACIO3S_15710 [Nocardioides sp. NPDC087217]|uniref:hypothetical protein n=1 Tax=Nocardioides sp. NPDC087217 TaxID=3364335 RepID=UPI0037FD30C8